VKGSSQHSRTACLPPRMGREVNSSGCNPENRPTKIPDPEGVVLEARSGFGPVRAVPLGTRRPRGPLPTAIQVKSLRDCWSGVAS